MARIVLFGATGYAGSRILDEATGRGHRVTAVARHVETLSGGGDSVRAVCGSLYDGDLVDQLTADADVLICAITSGPTDGSHTLPDALPIMLSAAERNGVRIAVVGGAGSLLLSENGQRVVTQLRSVAPLDKMREVDLHAKFLKGLQNSPADVDWFYLSPPVGFGAHVPGVRLGRYRVGGDVMLTDEQGSSAISGDDYATAFLDEIDHPRHHRCRFTVAY